MEVGPTTHYIMGGIREVDGIAQAALAPFERGGQGDAEGPYHVQHDLQTMMQDLVGIVRRASAR